MKVKTKADYRKRKHMRLRANLRGTAERPRMSVYVSGRNMTVQFIDDDAGVTLAAVTTLAGELKGSPKNRETAKRLGEAAAKAAQENNITAVVFDRGGFTYAGNVKVLADAAREAGLTF
jgi:large subunit ribosomal protein L18